jgi:hypothetical protein
MRAILALLLLPGAALADSVGIYPLRVLGEADPAYDKLAFHLRSHMVRFGGMSVVDISGEAVCKEDDVACLVGAGVIAAVDKVVVGAVEKFSDGYAVRLHLVDVKTSSHKEAKRHVKGGPDELRGGMELLSCELLGVTDCTGMLKVSTTLGDTTLDIDDKYAGGWKPGDALALPVGPHMVRAERKGRATPGRPVYIDYRTELPLTVALSEPPACRLHFMEGEGIIDPFAAPAAAATAGEHPCDKQNGNGPPWAAIATLAGGAVAAGVGAVMGLQAQQNWGTMNKKFNDGTLAPGEGKSLRETAQGQALGANVLYAVGAVAGGAGVALFFIKF